MSKVSNEGLLIAHVGSGHIAESPGDVCYDNAGLSVTVTLLNKAASANLSGGTTRVFIHGNPIWHAPATIPTSEVDPAGMGTFGGVANGLLYCKEAVATSWSGTLLLEGKGAVRTSDPTLQNAGNCAGTVVEGTLDNSAATDFWDALKACTITTLHGGSSDKRRINSPEDPVPQSPIMHHLEVNAGEAVAMVVTRADVTLVGDMAPVCANAPHAEWTVERTFSGRTDLVGTFYGDSFTITPHTLLDLFDGISLSEAMAFVDDIRNGQGFTPLEDISVGELAGTPAGVTPPEEGWDPSTMNLGGALDKAIGEGTESEESYKRRRGGKWYGTLMETPNPEAPEPKPGAPKPPANEPPNPLKPNQSWSDKYRWTKARTVKKEFEIDSLGVLALIFGLSPTEYKIQIKACAGDRTVLLRVYPSQEFKLKFSISSSEHAYKNPVVEKIKSGLLTLTKVAECYKWLCSKAGRDADVKILRGFYFQIKAGYKGCDKTIKAMIGPNWFYPNLVGFYFEMELGADPFIGYKQELPVSVLNFAFPGAEAVASQLRAWKVGRADIVFSLGLEIAASLSFGMDHHWQLHALPFTVTPKIEFSAMLVIDVAGFTLLKGGFTFPLTVEVVFDHSDKADKFLMLKGTFTVSMLGTLKLFPDSFFEIPLADNAEIFKFPLELGPLYII